MKLIKNKPKIGFSEVSLLFTLLFTGGFNEYISCAVSTLLCVFLIIKIAQQKCVKLRVNLVFIGVCVTTLFYLISTFYAIDSGMAFVGFLKFLPVLLYLLLLFQNESERDTIIKHLPFYTTVMSFLSIVLMFIPKADYYFNVEGRLAGFFQYPNTYAMFVLVSILLIVSYDKRSIYDYVSLFILCITLVLTQSRTVFVLAFISVAVMLLCKKGKKTKLIVAVSIITFVGIYFAMYPLLKEHEFFSRFYAISVFESTFAGRLLYYYDALAVIFKHPFGLGYMGYYYIEQSIQSGVYAIKYIHNDALQLILDVGFIPFILYIITVAKSLFSKSAPLSHKIILSTMFLHSLLDFDLQFIAMTFVMLLFMDYNSSSQKVLKKSGAKAITLVFVLGLISAYFCVALALSHFDYYEASANLYNNNTQNKTSLIIKEDDPQKRDEIADEILSRNSYVQVAYSAKVEYAKAQGDIESVIKYKNTIFKIAPFDYDEYEDYCYTLIEAATIYEESGDFESAGICKEELINTKEKLSQLNDRLSYLGKLIDDQPKTTLPSDILSYIDTNC